MIDFKVLKEAARIEDMFKYYGLKPNRNGMVCCPFHRDKRPSLKIYPRTNSFYCFGCGAGGDVIRFVQLMENTTALEAAVLINSVLNLGLDGKKPKPEMLREIRRREKEQAERFEFIKWSKLFYDKVCRELYTLEKMMDRSEVFSDVWTYAAKEKDYYEYLASPFLSGDVEAQKQLYREYRENKLNINPKNNSKKGDLRR